MIKRCPLCRGVINNYLCEGKEEELGYCYNAEAIE